MSTSKAFLVTAGLVAVLCVPLGYRISNSNGSQSAAGSNATSAVETATPVATPSAAPSFESSALFAEWRELHARYGSNAQALPAIYDAISALKDPFRRQGFRSALIAEWVEMDPAGGFSFYLGKGRDEAQRKQFFEEWLARDAHGAVDALKPGNSGWDGVARDCLTNIAHRLPASVADIAARLPKSDSYWDNSVRDAFAIVADGGLASVRQAAEAITGASREQALAGVAMAWGKTDLDATIAWAKSLPDGTDRDEIIRTALLGKAAVDPTVALDRVGSVPSGGRNAFFASTTGARVLSAAAEADFDTTVDWLKANPGRLGREDLMGLVQPITERLNADAAGFLTAHSSDGSLAALVPAIDNALLNGAAGLRPAIWDWLKTQPENESTRSLKEQVLSSASYQEPNLALDLVKELPNTPEGDRQVKYVAERLFNGGNMLHRFDPLLTQAPDRLREPLVEAAFGFLRGNSLDDPQRWINNLSLLPAGSRTKGAESLASAWAESSPEEAIAWAGSLTPGETQNTAMAAIASAWAGKAAHDAAAWVASLPAGAERDRSAESLVSAVAQKYPQEAWDWALSIGDTAGRERAAGQAAKMMAAKDPATARQWIQSGPFSDQTKAELQASLDKPSSSKRPGTK